MTVNVQIDLKEQSWPQKEAGRLGQSLDEYITNLVSSREDEFRSLVDTWLTDTMFCSSIQQMAMHPAYQRIIGLGQPAVPLILRELRDNPADWFWALKAITGEDPANSATSFDEGAAAWIEWGIKRGYLA